MPFDDEVYKGSLIARRRKLGILKRRVTTTIRLLDALLLKPRADFGPADAAILTANGSQLKKQYTECTEYSMNCIEWMITQGAPVENLEKQEDDLEPTSIVFFQKVAAVTLKLNECGFPSDIDQKIIMPAPAPAPEPAPAPVAAAAEPVFNVTPVPAFDPDKHDYLKFKERWQLYAGERGDLSNAQKLTELVSKVVGEALEAIDMFSFTDDNYTKALAELDRRFGDPKILIAKYTAKYMQAPECTKMEAKPLQKLYDTLNTANANLEGLGKPLDPTIVLPIWEQKFPKPIRSQAVRQSKKLAEGEEWTIQRFLKCVFNELQVQKELEIGQPPKKSETTQAAAAKSGGNSGSGNNNGGGDQAKKAVAAAASQGNKQGQGQQGQQGGNKKPQQKQGQQGKKQFPKQCYACDSSEHHTHMCPKFVKMSQQQRFECLKKHECCLLCMRPGHGVADCPFADNRKCVVCGGLHNTFLHRDGADKGATKKTTYAAAATHGSGASD